MNRLDEEGITSRVFNRASNAEAPPKAVSILHRQIRWFFWFSLRSPEKLLLVYTGRPLVRFLAYLLKLLRGKRYILRIGEERIFETFRSGNWLSKFITSIALRKADEVILVSPHFRNLMLKIGVDKNKVHVIPGFIPPVDINMDPIADIDIFKQTRTPILSANGQWSCSTDDDYGLRILFEAIQELKQTYPSIGLLLSLYGRLNIIHGIEQLREELKIHGISKNIFVRSDPHEFWPVLKESDVFIRPTRTEGDSNSIREAIALGIPVVASNPVPRPKQCILFENGNSSSLATIVHEVLDQLPKYRNILKKAKQSDNAKKIIELIKKHI
jgi:glycosyltransferase involved in cell wall biosynthesis